MVRKIYEGKIRFRHESLKKTSVLEQVSRDLKACEGVDKVTSNVRIGSILVDYDKDTVAVDRLCSVFHAKCSDHSQPQPHRSRKPVRDCRLGAMPTRRRVVNLGMLSSLIGSLLALTVKSKAVHVQLGLLFTVLSLLHLFEKRKTLLV